MVLKIIYCTLIRIKNMAGTQGVKMIYMYMWTQYFFSLLVVNVGKNRGIVQGNAYTRIVNLLFVDLLISLITIFPVDAWDKTFSAICGASSTYR